MRYPEWVFTCYDDFSQKECNTFQLLVSYYNLLNGLMFVPLCLQFNTIARLVGFGFARDTHLGVDHYLLEEGMGNFWGKGLKVM